MENCIATYRGIAFDLLNPKASMIDIEDIAHGLAYQCRFNGQTNHFYSVAQHSVMVASLVPKPLRLVALLHDAAEAYLGDMVRPLKALIPEFSRFEAKVATAIGEAFGVELAEIPKEVKRADLIALATEKRDLMPASTEPWPQINGIVPLPTRILPLSPPAAKQEFLRQFEALTGKRERRCA